MLLLLGFWLGVFSCGFFFFVGGVFCLGFVFKLRTYICPGL